ncbi:hypothetical protein ACSSZE_03465 [Acidithiobacillus caldus]
MGQAKLRKLHGTYPKQTPKPQRVNDRDAGRAFFALYREILGDIQKRFPERDDFEEQAHAALVRTMELGVRMGFSYHEPLILLVSWQDRTMGWLQLSMPEKCAIAKLLHESEGFTEISRRANRAYLERVKVRVAGDTVSFGAGSPWNGGENHVQPPL